MTRGGGGLRKYLQHKGKDLRAQGVISILSHVMTHRLWDNEKGHP